MPSTHSSLHYHLIFSTKDRRPLITKDWRERLHAYLGGIEDHVHLLVGLKTSHRLDYFARDVKADSSEWIHKQVGGKLFAWQKGYGVFSVSPSNVDGVKRYVLSQEEHHQRKSFQDEYVELLKASGIEYDERYVW